MGGSGRLGEETLRRETGLGWDEWFLVLARWGAVRRGHRDAVRFLREEHGLPKRLAEPIVLRYEGAAEASPHEVRLQRTVRATLEATWDAWTRPGLLSRWLTTRATNQLRVGGRYEMAGGNRGRYLELEPPRRLRMSWESERHCPGTEVEVSLAPREEKVTVRVIHRRLATREDEVRMDEVWSTALARLQGFLEGGEKGESHLWVQARS